MRKLVKAVSCMQVADRIQLCQLVIGLLIAGIGAWYTHSTNTNANDQRNQEKQIALRQELSQLERTMYANEVVADGFVNIATYLADGFVSTEGDEGDAVRESQFRLSAAQGYFRYVQANDVMLHQAELIIKELIKIDEEMESDHGSVLASDHLALAHGYYNSGNLLAAERHLMDASNSLEDIDEELNTRIMIEMAKAVVKFGQGLDDDAYNFFASARKMAGENDGVAEAGSYNLAAVYAAQAAVLYGLDGKWGEPASAEVRGYMNLANDNVKGLKAMELTRLVEEISKVINQKRIDKANKEDIPFVWDAVTDYLHGIRPTPNSGIRSHADLKKWVEAVKKARAILSQPEANKILPYGLDIQPDDTAMPPAPQADPNA